MSVSSNKKRKTVNRKKSSTPKVAVSFKKHVLPPVLGIAFMLCGFGVLNNQLLTAQVTKQTFEPVTENSNITTQPKVDTSVSDKNQLVIQNIKVNAPIIDEQSTQENDIQRSLRNGVVHYGNTAYPGQVGNIVLFGHSSGQIWTPGDYKFVFTLLDSLKQDDRITVDYNGVRYVYRVVDSKVVKPTDFSVVQQTSTPKLTLITCSPVGSSKYRLVVIAEQISPDPATAAPLKSAEPAGNGGSLPGNPSLPVNPL